MRELPPRFVIAVVVPILLVIAGTLGFHYIEEQSFFDSLYLTIVTLTTVGYGDIVPRQPAGKVFTMFLVVGGVFTLFYGATTAIQAIVGGELAQFLGKRQMQRKLEQMHDHIIVCGYGRMGRLVCREFAQQKVPFVLLEENADLLHDFEELPASAALQGDATSDDDLRRAGIERARGLVAVMHSDAENLFATMSARLLNAKIFIVARVEDMRSESKLLRAGADRVVSPYQIGGEKVAQAILKPTVTDFIELATRTEHIELQMEETSLGEQSTLVGKRLSETDIRSRLRCIIVAVKKPSGHMVFNPPPDTVLDKGDILVAIGHREELDRLEKLANPV